MPCDNVAGLILDKSLFARLVLEIEIIGTLTPGSPLLRHTPAEIEALSLKLKRLTDHYFELVWRSPIDQSLDSHVRAMHLAACGAHTHNHLSP